MDLLSQQPALSSDPETKDFDLLSGNRWIYPENYPVRDYQFTIAKKALFHNTLICLPTGLGKTFIAAVVMYNYWRWYPRGIIVFLAPTKPLVTQQIDACHNIMGIPISDTIELTGRINPKQREAIWREKRVIFATPQTFQKDLETKIIPTELIKCLVIDEAHKATGKHSYSESIRMLNEQNPYFRIIGLSATPGSKLEAVQEVIRHLKITHLELRDDTSPDIIPYINERKTDIIVVSLGQDLIDFKERYIQIMDRHVKVLINNNVIRSAAANISKGQMFILMQQCQTNKDRYKNHGTIMKTLTILTTMAHAYEVITRHGLRSFYNFYKAHMTDAKKSWLRDEFELGELVEEIGNYIGPFPNIANLIDGTETEIPNNIVFGHGKFNKLKELLLQHFNRAKNNNIDTRAMIFVETRDICGEIYVLLMQLRPLIRPQIFVGQAGLKQKAQTKAVDNFRNDVVNVLVSTSVGEEGLDFGEVDLIICFEISQVNPTRLVQRMGRTGRKRDGHIIILVTDGKEHQTLKASMTKRDGLNKKVLTSNAVISSLLPSSPKMIPDSVHPECLKMNITVIPKMPGYTAKSKKKPSTKGKATKRPTKVSAVSKVVPVVEIDCEDMPDNIQEKKTGNARNKTSQAKIIDQYKRPGQGTLTKFFTINNDNHPPEDDNIIPMRKEKIELNIAGEEFVRAGNIIKPSDVKILTSDTHVIDFLTLCTIKNSEKELINNEKHEISYLPKIESFNDDIFNFEVPNYQILSCLKALGEYVKPGQHEQHNFTHETFGEARWSYQEPSCSRYSIKSSDSEGCLVESKFDDLLNESDSDETCYAPDGSSPPRECVDWSNNDFHEEFAYEDEINFSEKKRKNCSPLESNSVVVTGGNFLSILEDTSDEELVEESSFSTHFQQLGKRKSGGSLNNSREKLQRSSLSSDGHGIVEESFMKLLDDSLDGTPDVSGNNLAVDEVNNKINSEIKSQAVDESMETDDVIIIDEEIINKPPPRLSSFQENKNDNYLSNKTNFAVPDTVPIDALESNFFSDNEVVEKSPQRIKKKNSSQRKLEELSLRKSQKKNSHSQNIDFNELTDIDVNFSTLDSADFRINKTVSGTKKTQDTKDADTIDFNTLDFFTSQSTSVSNKKNNPRPKDLLEKNSETNFSVEDSQETKFYTPPERLPETVETNFLAPESYLENKSSKRLVVAPDADTVPVELSEEEKTLLDTEDTFFPLWNDSPPKLEDARKILISQNKSTDQGCLSGAGTSKRLQINRYNQAIENELRTEADTAPLAMQNLETNNSFVEKKSTNELWQKKAKSQQSIDTVQLPDDIGVDFGDWETNTLEKSNNLIKEQSQPEDKLKEKINESRLSLEKSETAVIIDDLFASDFDDDFEIPDHLTPQQSTPKKLLPTKSSEKKNKLSLKNIKSPEISGDQSPDLTKEKKKPSKIEFDINDYDWESDFESTSDPLIESKHFGVSKPLVAPPPKPPPACPPKKSTDSDSDSGWLSKFPKEKKNNKLNNKELFNKKREKSCLKSRSTFESDGDSDNDFMATKIIAKSVFNGHQSNLLNIRDKSVVASSSKSDYSSRIGPVKSKVTSLEDLGKFVAPKKYESKSQKSLGRSNTREKKLRKKKKNKRSAFIDDEAEVSSEENYSHGSDEVDDDGEDLEGFVSYTQNYEEEPDMRALYLQSIKSPRAGRGRFIIKKLKSPPQDVQIYSQAVHEPDNYLHVSSSNIFFV